MRGVKLRGLSGLVLAAALAAGTPALAEVKPGASATEAGPSVRQQELSRRYVELMQSDQLEEAIRAMAGSDPSMQSDLPRADQEFLINLAAELTTDMMPDLMAELVPVYASTFSEAELEAMIGFYDTEMGRSIIDKTYSSLPEVNAALMAVMPRLLDKMATRMCAHYGCDPDDIRAEIYSGAGMEPSGAVPVRTK
jgi:hypothetical protein